MAVCCICLFFDSLADVCRKGTMMVEEKLDRRSAYSRMVIEDTFLEMLREGLSAGSMWQVSAGGRISAGELFIFIMWIFTMC